MKINALLNNLDPNKVFFVVGHQLIGQEKYLVENNTKFDVYSIITSLMEKCLWKQPTLAQVELS